MNGEEDRDLEDLDARLAAAIPAHSLSPGFRAALRARLNQERHRRSWPETIPDITHLAGCALAIALLLFAMPQYSFAIVSAGTGFTAVTYILQVAVQSALEQPEDAKSEPTAIGLSRVP